MGTLAYTPILAHFGHWYVSLPTFLAPVALLAIAVKVSERRARIRARNGDTSHLSVVVTETTDRTTLTVRGALDHLALLDIEDDLGKAVGRDLPVLIDLRQVGRIDDDSAWGITEVVRTMEDADIEVVVGSSEALNDLRRICTLEGVTIAANESVALPVGSTKVVGVSDASGANE